MEDQIKLQIKKSGANSKSNNPPNSFTAGSSAAISIIKKRLRLAIIQSFLPSESHGGVGYFTHYFANELMARGHDVTVFSMQPAPPDASYCVRVLELPSSLRKSKLAHLYLFSWLVARQNYSSFDVIHAQGDDFLLWPFLRKIPLVRTFHGSALAEALYATKWKVRLMQLSFYPLEWLAALNADAYAAVSQATTKHLPFVKQITGQGVNLQSYVPSTIKAAQPTLLFVGHRLHDRKRGYLLLDIFKQKILPKLPDAQLWLVCEDEVEQSNVKCFRNLDEASLIKLYQAAWVFCLPSSYEGFGRPYIEAMACGTPVVATPNPGAIEILQNGVYGVIAPDYELDQALLNLLNSSEHRTELAQKGLQRVRDFSWEQVVDKYEAIYQAVLARKVKT